MSICEWPVATPEPAPAQDTPPPIEAEWERCKPWIEAALAYDGGHYGIDDVWSEIAAGNASFWPGKRSAVITQFWNFPKLRACNYWLAGGDLNELIQDMQPVITEWAKANGCSKMIIAGRGGWERALERSGFTKLWTALGRDI